MFRYLWSGNIKVESLVIVDARKEGRGLVFSCASDEYLLSIGWVLGVVLGFRDLLANEVDVVFFLWG